MNDELFDPLPPDLAELEAELAALAPVAPDPEFADRVVVESVLRSVTPVAPSAGFAARVVAESVRPARSNVLRFARLAVPFAAAAAVAAMVVPGVWSPDARNVVVQVADAEVVEAAPAAPVAAVSTYAHLPVDLPPQYGDEVVHLPVINLPDGRAYRPVVRGAGGAPSGFRAMPGGAVMPVSFTQESGVEYHRVEFE